LYASVEVVVMGTDGRFHDPVNAIIRRRFDRQFTAPRLQPCHQVIGHRADHRRLIPEPVFDEPVATVTVGLDGTCMLMCESGWCEAMVGTFGFYNQEGKRLHTVYTAATPEYGKTTFFERFDRKLDRVKAAHPGALYVDLADGARENWLYLDSVTQRQVVDFYHAAQYVWKSADVLFAGTAAGPQPWVDEWCHRLKHEPGAAEALIADPESRGAALGRKRLPAELDSALTYFRNQVAGGRMGYSTLVSEHIPIGSGVTEAACKVLVKQRLCGSGMRWKERGAASVLSVRCLTYTPERWTQFWSRIDRSGFPVAA
jgi:hypothetical protein